MALALSQTAAIIRYELLMAWRRRALLVMGGFFLVTLIGFTAIQPPSQPIIGDIVEVNTSANPPTITRRDAATGELIVEEATEEQIQSVPQALRDISLITLSSTQMVVMLVAIIFPVLVAITVVVFFAETIPLDRQYRIRELFNSAPVSSLVYLGSKLLGAWAALAITMLFVMIGFGIFARITLGAFDLTYYLQSWLLVVLPFALTCTGWSVLAASGAGSRRKAILIGLVLLPGALLLYTLISVQFWSEVMLVGSRITPQEPLTLTMLFGAAISQTAAIQFGFLISVGFLFLVVWAWSRMRA